MSLLLDEYSHVHLITSGDHLKLIGCYAPKWIRNSDPLSSPINHIIIYCVISIIIGLIVYGNFHIYYIVCIKVTLSLLQYHIIILNSNSDSCEIFIYKF